MAFPLLRYLLVACLSGALAACAAPPASPLVDDGADPGARGDAQEQRAPEEHDEDEDAVTEGDEDVPEGELADAGWDVDAGALEDELDDVDWTEDDEWIEDELAVEEPGDEGALAEEDAVVVAEIGGPTCSGENRNPALPSPMPKINGRPGFLHVYVNNIENLKTATERCRGDWTDLIHYMKTVKPSPDVFLVQQISNQAQLNVLVERMSNALPGKYRGIIADKNPWKQASPCGAEKAKQTNAIIYRVGRLEPIGDKHVWQSWAFRKGKCRRNTQARTRNVMQKFRDKVNGKTVTVASIHWSTASGSGPDPACAKKNMLETDQKLHRAGYRADLYIFGGDMNEPDRRNDGSFRPWYAVANGDKGGALRWRDPVFRMCKRKSGSTQRCLDDNWTVGSGRRIDFLFAQNREGCMVPTKRTHTVSFNEADAASRRIVGSDNPLNYSDHRAIRSFIYY